jgi:hypothetical protein
MKVIIATPFSKIAPGLENVLIETDKNISKNKIVLFQFIFSS